MFADYLFQGARVIDCYSAEDKVRDLAVKDGQICGAEDLEGAKTVIDASGCILTPGLIDFHVHSAAGFSELAVYPESQCFPTGVTAAVDAGSAGVANFDAFVSVSSFHRVHLYAFLHISPAGIPTVKYHETHDPKYVDRAAIRALFQKYPGKILGLKVRQSRDIVGELGLTPLKTAIDIAEELGCPIACHTTDSPGTTEELVGLFRRGDIFAHAFHGKGNTILDAQGKILPEVWAARERGVIFDAACGRNHFSLDVAGKAMEQGFLPDIISTDLTAHNHWAPGRVFSLPYVMSKFLALGMSLYDVVDRVTARPAAQIGQAEALGSLRVGTPADIAIHRLIEHPTIFEDSCGGTLPGNRLLKTEMTLLGGKPVYRAIDF